MPFLIALLVLGVVVGAGMNSLMNNRGNALGFPLSVGLGVATSVIAGWLLLNYGNQIVGEGPESILAMIAAPIAAIIAILLVRAIKK
ncbi:MAG: hypothetical protein IPK01_15300 [Acidobacteria bacterium]|nr:hypothetical protein [Acidobacteriota bacterium]